MIPDHDDIDTSMEIHLFQAIHQLPSHFINLLQWIAHLENTEGNTGGQFSQKLHPKKTGTIHNSYLQNWSLPKAVNQKVTNALRQSYYM